MQPTRTFRVLTAVAVLALSATLSSCVSVVEGSAQSASDGEPVRVQEYELLVTFALLDGMGSSAYEVGPDCETSGTGYSDIGNGTPIQVRDNAGTLIGSGSLGTLITLQWPTQCRWSDTIMVPTRQQFYVIEVGTRGEVTFTEDELSDSSLGPAGALAELTLG